MALPELYRVAKKGHWFGLRRFLLFMFQGAYQVREAPTHSLSPCLTDFPSYQSAVVFFFINYAYTTTTARTDGYNPGQYEMSTVSEGRAGPSVNRGLCSTKQVMVIGAVMVANVFTGLYTESWNGWVWFAVALGPILIWVYTVSLHLIGMIKLSLMTATPVGHLFYHPPCDICHVSCSRFNRRTLHG
jgi:phospholipid-translocating ATPase